MKEYLILRILLAFHLAGLTIMAGTTIIDFVTFKTFCRLTAEDTNKASGLLPLMSVYGSLLRVGAVILMLTGASMFILLNGIWWQQLWFKIKMGLVVLLILNGMLVGNKNGIKLRSMAYEGLPDLVRRTADVRDNLNRFYITQLVILSLIILLSAIKFDRN
ncbi:hypothetical protein [Chitinophaga ginsengisoli]|uniref:Uncharacterized protein n=1 Tax=Chitinophaga ginsengisoli TaxID=363837 RepID=A0A2P8G518_9BACT|nr:hypothetical protein [Chitinophaga ginsengisoli]PSL29057.1 hypothetical protein CLV42_107204 [Chitinophaga ginsengisoli]